VSEVAELAATLVRIDSVNPSLHAGAAGETEIAAFVADWLERAGLDVTVVEPVPGRPSVVGVARGTGGGRSLLLNAHLDTVGVAAVENPFDARIADGRLYGRGSYDMKGALAAALLAAADAVNARLAGDVIVAAVADEEVASIGTEAVLETLSADGCIVCEPTELEVAVAHRGFAGFEIETLGVAAHGSQPDLGVDAILRMGAILVALETLDRRLQAGSRHQLLGAGSLHASLIEGGQEFSSYPERCIVTGERRTLPGETAEDVERDLRALLEPTLLEPTLLEPTLLEPNADAEIRMLTTRDAFELDEAHELVRLVLAAAESTAVVGLPFWADSALTGAAGIPTVLFGPIGAGAHAAVEWVDIGSLERCRQVYLKVATALCR
jgi:acetylornithine deacetylase